MAIASAADQTGDKECLFKLLKLANKTEHDLSVPVLNIIANTLSHFELQDLYKQLLLGVLNKRKEAGSDKNGQLNVLLVKTYLMTFAQSEKPSDLVLFVTKYASMAPLSFRSVEPLLKRLIKGRHANEALTLFLELIQTVENHLNTPEFVLLTKANYEKVEDYVKQQKFELILGFTRAFLDSFDSEFEVNVDLIFDGANSLNIDLETNTEYNCVKLQMLLRKFDLEQVGKFLLEVSEEVDKRALFDTLMTHLKEREIYSKDDFYNEIVKMAFNLFKGAVEQEITFSQDIVLFSKHCTRFYSLYSRLSDGKPVATFLFEEMQIHESGRFSKEVIKIVEEDLKKAFNRLNNRFLSSLKVEQREVTIEVSEGLESYLEERQPENKI